MLSLCFAVLWIFLNKLASNGLDGRPGREEITENLAVEFLEIFSNANWSVLCHERESTLLIVAMLTNFFLSHNIMREDFTNVFAYMLD